jgi:hypothetical protein
MTAQNTGVNDNDIIESMSEAFDNGSFYGLEYVLDEWIAQTPAAAPVDWFGSWDFRG